MMLIGIMSITIGEKQGILISWYDRVREFLISVWDRRKEIFYSNGLVGEVN